MKSEPESSAFSEFEVRVVDIKGRQFSIRELSAEEYDKCTALATNEAAELDTVQLLRWMVIKSVIDPKLDLGGLGKLPFGTVRALSREVNFMHFPPEEGLEGNV